MDGDVPTFVANASVILTSSHIACYDGSEASVHDTPDVATTTRD